MIEYVFRLIKVVLTLLKHSFVSLFLNKYSNVAIDSSTSLKTLFQRCLICQHKRIFRNYRQKAKVSICILSYPIRQIYVYANNNQDIV